MAGEQIQEGLPTGLAECLERLADLLGSNGEDRPMVHIELHQVFEADPEDVLRGLRELGIPKEREALRSLN